MNFSQSFREKLEGHLVNSYNKTN